MLFYSRCELRIFPGIIVYSNLKKAMYWKGMILTL